MLRKIAVVIRRAWRADRALTLVGFGAVAALGATLVGLALDPRVVTGAPAWLKPAKFAVSGAIYCFTFLWLLGQVRGRARLRRVVADVTAGALAVEIGLIALQAGRGTTSHFNFTTPFDGVVFGVMGFSIVLLWLAAAAVAVVLLRQRGEPARAWALRWALLIALVGMGEGLLMTTPSEARVAEARALGQPAGVRGGHAVGVLDGGPGLPVVGWSTEGGDLRPAHFVGLHGLQALPVVGWLVARRSRLGAGHRAALVSVVGAAYLGLVVLLAWQALRGQPLIAPDAPTLGALGGLAAAAALGAAAVAAHARLAGAPIPGERRGPWRPAEP